MKTIPKSLADLTVGDVIVHQGVQLHTVLSVPEPTVTEIWDGEDFVPTAHAWKFTTEYTWDCNGTPTVSRRTETVAPVGAPETVVYRVLA